LKKHALDYHFLCLEPWKIRAVYLSHGRVGGRSAAGPVDGLKLNSFDAKLIGTI